MKLWNAWVALLSRREKATALAVSRMIAGSTVAVHLFWMWWTGTAAAVWVDTRFGGMRYLDAGPLLRHLGRCTPTMETTLLAAGIAAAVLMTLGLYTRVTAVLTWFCWKSLTGFNDIAGGSSDDLLVNGLFLLMLSGSGNALSLDARWRGKGGLVPAWPRYILIVQLVVMYFTTGLQKISIGWIPGGPADALWYILQQPTWQRHDHDMRLFAALFPLTQLGTIVTWLFEAGAPVLLLAFWFRETPERPGRVRAFFNRVDFRTKYLALGVLLHGGIWWLMEVGPFMNAVFVLYAACFHPDEWERVLSRVRARFLPAPANPPGTPANP
ncbi:MAG TPA: HTTM domain-containing protein [bacterium]|nr:HTTM domain-containing protein [bacterium]